MSVYSERDRGTTFRIYLPRISEPPTLTTAHVETVARPLGQETILLVEDEPALLKVGKRMLERLGYRIIAADGPTEALRLAEQSGEAIDLVMTDVVMPEMNGPDLARNLRALFPGIRCLFMSGYTANVIAHHGVLDRNVLFLPKPFSPEELAAKVREALDR